MIHSLQSALEKRWCRLLVCLSPLAIMLIWAIGPGFFFAICDDLTQLQIIRTEPLVNKTISVIWGRIISSLYGAVPGVEWYSLWVGATLHLALISLHASALKLRRWPLHIFLWISQLVASQFFSFTTAAFFSIFAGIMVFILQVDASRKGRSIALMLMGAALIFNGAIIRMTNPLLCCMGLAGVLGLVRLLRRQQRFSVLVLLLAVCIASQAAVMLADRAAVNSDPELRFYRDYAISRGKYMDNSAHDARILVELGMDESEAYLMDQLFYSDLRIHDAQWYEDAYKVFGAGSDGLAGEIYRMARNCVRQLRAKDLGLWTAFLTLLAIPLCLSRRKKALPWLFLTLVMLALELLYLLYMYRAITRVTLIMDLMAIYCSMVIYLSFPKNEAMPASALLRRGPMAAIACAAALLCMVNAVQFARFHNENLQAKAANAALKSYQAEHEGEIRYVFQAPASNLAMNAAVSLRTVDQYLPEHLLGDWYVHSPYWKNQMRAEGFGDYLDRGLDMLLEEDVEMITYRKNEYLGEALVNFYAEYSGLEVEYTMKSAAFDDSFIAFKFNVVSPAA